jgi:type IV secretion system protein VirB6
MTLYNLCKSLKTELFVALLAVLIFCLLTTPVRADTTDYSDTNLKANHQNSMLMWENYSHRLAPTDDCISTGKVLKDHTDINSVCIPGFLTTDNSFGQTCQDSNESNVIVAAIAVRVAFYAYSALNPAMWLISGAIMGFEYLHMIDVCTNTYVIQAHEYINRDTLNLSCKIDDNYVVYDTSSGATPLTIDDVPFYYHCDPTYDPFTDTYLSSDPNDPKTAAMLGRTWGYMGSGSKYCIGGNATHARKDMVGAVVVEYATVGYRVFNSHCQGPTGIGVNSWNFSGGKYAALLKPSPTANAVITPQGTFYAYYKYFVSTGKTQICVVALDTLSPVNVGCGFVAPPGEDNSIDAFLRQYVSNTRCYYMIDDRTDLNSLGKAIIESPTDSKGVDRIAVGNFLASELHITSTVVGCIKDMLVKIFINDPTSPGTTPFFQIIQGRLRQIVLSVLVLYVAIVGIRIMSSPQPPQKAEFIMMILKYAIVMYFALGDAFYSVDRNGNVIGLYPQLLGVGDEIANLFLQAQNNYDPIGYCTYIKNGQNILGEVEINTSEFPGLVATQGYNDVKMTVWDLVDCKVVNYLNAGTCKYGLGDMTLVWSSSLALFASGGSGIVLAVTIFLYAFMLLLVIFKFAHIFIQSAIIVTVLIFLAPIFVCFFLFEATKGIFDKWMKMIFGYILYPSLLFAFLALMLATLDSIYYGPLDTGQAYLNTNVGGNPSGGNQIGAPVSLSTACQGIDSLFCSIIGQSDFSVDLCRDLSNRQFNQSTETFSVSGFSDNYSRLNQTYVDLFNKHMTKLMLFALLFYLFMDSISSFMAALLSVQEIQGKGSINAFNAMGKVAGVAGKGLKSAFKAATK